MKNSCRTLFKQKFIICCFLLVLNSCYNRVKLATSIWEVKMILSTCCWSICSIQKKIYNLGKAWIKAAFKISFYAPLNFISKLTLGHEIFNAKYKMNLILINCFLRFFSDCCQKFLCCNFNIIAKHAITTKNYIFASVMICKSFVWYIKAGLMYAKAKEHELQSKICIQQNNFMSAHKISLHFSS